MGTPEFKSIGILGGGLIGQSWASLYCAFGLDVTVFDPDPNVQTALADFVESAWPHLRALGHTNSEHPVQPKFSTDIASLEPTDFIQECGPDRIETKRKIIADAEAVIGPNVPIASSTSSLLASDLQQGTHHPERIFVAHPMNPPHMVPMVELVSGKCTDPAVIDRAETFYQHLQRVTVRVKKEVVGHLANRLTSALYREAVYIAATGIADVADIDKAIAYGPGVRWALMGPHLTYHMGGGTGGYRHYLNHLGPTQEARWQDHGTAPLTPRNVELLVSGMDQALETQDQHTLAARRDAALAEIIQIKQKYGL